MLNYYRKVKLYYMSYSYSILFLFLIIIFNFIFLSFFSFLKTKRYYNLRVHYLKKSKRKYNEKKLITFSDKINWLIIHDTKLLKGKCADKILLHKYSKRVLGKDICNKILKIYHNVNQINLNDLPKKFVLKTNHGSGYNIIVQNKSDFDFLNAKKLLSKWMSYDYGKRTTEFHYSFINKRIFIHYS